MHMKIDCGCPDVRPWASGVDIKLLPISAFSTHHFIVTLSAFPTKVILCSRWFCAIPGSKSPFATVMFVLPPSVRIEEQEKRTLYMWNTKHNFRKAILNSNMPLPASWLENGGWIDDRNHFASRHDTQQWALETHGLAAVAILSTCLLVFDPLILSSTQLQFSYSVQDYWVHLPRLRRSLAFQKQKIWTHEFQT